MTDQLVYYAANCALGSHDDCRVDGCTCVDCHGPDGYHFQPPQISRLASSTYGLWHWLYCRWFDAREVGHHRRAAAWGWAADRVVRLSDRVA